MIDMLCQIRPKAKKLVQYSKQKNGRTSKKLTGKVTKKKIIGLWLE